MTKKSTKIMNGFRKELDTYEKEGVPLWLDGMLSTPEEIVKAHQIAEDVTYMRDYVQDANGRLSRLEFDRIKDS